MSTGHSSYKLSVEQKAEIVRLYEAGSGVTELAKQFGVGQPAISYLIKSRGADVRPREQYKLTEEQKAEICTLHIAGENVTALGRRFGLNESSVRSLLQRRGILQKRVAKEKPKRLCIVCSAVMGQFEKVICLKCGSSMSITEILKTDPGIPDRFWNCVAKAGEDECWLWKKSKNRAGYGVFIIRGGGSRHKQTTAHRTAWVLTYGDPGELGVLHKCDNPPCCNPAHLFLGTNVDNTADCVSKGRQARGERNRNAALTEQQVIAIRQRFADGVHEETLMTEFGATMACIRGVVLRRTWKHLP